MVIESIQENPIETKIDAPRPGGEVARYSLWNSRVEIGSMKEVGVKTPDGGYIGLQDGEHFAVVRDFEKSEYKAIIKNDNGEVIRVLEEGRLGLPGKEDAKYNYGDTIANKDVIETLEKSGELGKILSESYKLALKEFPELSGVDLKIGDPKEFPRLEKTGGFARHQSENKTGRPLVVMNLSKGIEHYKNLMTEREVSAKISAEKAGIKFEEFTPEMLAVFIYLHEMGHGYEYLKNVPDKESRQNKRKAEMDSLPLPGWDPAQVARELTDGGKLDIWYRDNREALKAKYPTKKSILEIQERAYHSINSEDIPDQVAAKIIKKHFKTLFGVNK